MIWLANKSQHFFKIFFSKNIQCLGNVFVHGPIRGRTFGWNLQRIIRFSDRNSKLVSDQKMRQRQTRVGADDAKIESGHSFIILKHFYYFETFPLFWNISIILQRFYYFATFLYISNIVMTPKIFWSPCKSDFWKVITSLELMVDFYHYLIGLGAYFGYKFHGFVFYP